MESYKWLIWKAVHRLLLWHNIILIEFNIKNQESLYSPNASADTQEFDMAISYTQTHTQTYAYTKACLKQSKK